MTGIGFAMINGAACRYCVSGDGPATLVLVHELGGSLNSWDGLVPLLSKSLRIIRYDLRGAGMSEKMPGAQSLDRLADDVPALLDHLGVTGKVALLGAAMGAAVAVRIATRHPARVGRLVLVGPALGIPPERHDAARAITESLDRDGLRAIADAMLPKAFPEELWASPADRETALARWFGADPEGYAANYRILIDESVRDELPRIACPTLVLAGAHDPFGPPDLVRPATATIPGVRFETIDGGHFVAVQAPERLADAIGDFIAAGA